MPRRSAMWVADSIFALRPLLWIPAVALYAAGSGARRGGGGPELLSLLFLLGAVHVANAVRDRRSDRANEKGWLTAHGVVGEGRLVALSAASLVAAIALGSEAPPPARALLLLALMLGAAYVAPGLELKRRAGWDLVANAFGYGGLAFLLGAWGSADRKIGGAEALAGIQAAGPYVLGVAAVTLATMIADRSGDEASGERTSAVALGEARARSAAIILAWGSALLGLLARDPVPMLWGVLAGGWLGLHADRIRDPAGWNRAAITMQGAFLAILAIRTSFPLIFAACVGGAASIYYFTRFGVAYPLTGLWPRRREAPR